MDPSLAGPPVPPPGPARGAAPSAPTDPPDGPPHPAPPSPARNATVVAHGTDPTEWNLGRFGPLQRPRSTPVQEPGPEAAAVVAAVPAQPAGRGESPWALPPQRLAVGVEESTPTAAGPPPRPTAPDADLGPAGPGPGHTAASDPAHPDPEHLGPTFPEPEHLSPTHPGPTYPGPERLGPERHAADEAGPDALDPTASAPATPGPAAHGPGSTGPAAHGPGPAGPATPGPAAHGPGPTGPATPGPAAHGPGPTGPATPGPATHGPEPTGPATPGPARPGVTGPGESGLLPGPQVPGGWHRSSWPEQPPPAGTAPAAGPSAAYPDPVGYPELGWSPDSGIAPTAEDFARRRQIRPADPIATMGVRAVVNRIGLVKLPPGQHEQEVKRDIEMVRRNFGGLRQVTVVNPKGGAGKTVAILLLAMTFGQKRGGYVLAWDNNETQGTLGMRAQQDFHSRTVRDMLRDLGQFQGPHGRIGDLSQYVRSQGEGMFDVLASDESATGGEMLTAAAFAEIREVVSRFYKLIFVDTGNNVRAQNWQAAMDATDQLVVTMSARNDSAETAARMLDHLEQSGRHRLVRQAVTVVSMPPSRKEIDLPAIQEHFAARTRAVLLAPYERLIDTGEPIRYGGLSSATRDAWLKIAAAVAEGL
nr:chromosome partitioning protein [Micromonospora antibiotica]